MIAWLELQPLFINYLQELNCWPAGGGLDGAPPPNPPPPEPKAGVELAMDPKVGAFAAAPKAGAAAAADPNEEPPPNEEAAPAPNAGEAPNPAGDPKD